VTVDVTVNPVNLVVSLADMKDYLSVDGTDEDAIITAMIKAATIKAQNFTGKSFITQTLKKTMDYFSSNSQPMYQGGCGQSDGNVYLPGTQSQEPVDLPNGPLQSVTSLTTYALDNTSTVFTASNYFVDTAGQRVCLNSGQVWPDSLRECAAVEIVYIAGYGDNASDVPEDIAEAIKQIVAVMYEERTTECALPCGASMILGMYKEPRGFGFNGGV
jgi:hypothetical protein